MTDNDMLLLDVFLIGNLSGLLCGLVFSLWYFARELAKTEKELYQWSEEELEKLRKKLIKAGRLMVAPDNSVSRIVGKPVGVGKNDEKNI
jgi:hypothetical protein